MSESANRGTAMAPGWTALAAWIITFALGYAGVGAFLGELIEGMDRSLIPKALPILFFVALVASLWLTVRWARSIGAARAAAAGAPPAGLGRRRFLAGAAGLVGGVVGAGLSVIGRLSGWMNVTGPALRAEVAQTDPNPRGEWTGSRVKSYRPLGATGAVVSDISLGTTQLFRNADAVALIRSALDRGVTYIDTSPDYAGARAENAIGEAIRGRRGELFLASKFCTPEGHLRQGASVQDYMASVEGSLQRLGTDRLDLVHVHACDSVDRLLDPNAHEAFDRLREQGKVRFMGVSTHTPNLEEVANAAIDSGRFHVMMLAYHHGAWPNLSQIIDRAAAKGIGIVAMKTLKGAKHQGLAEFRPEADAYSQAAFKWVLSDPSVSCLVVSFFDNQHPDEYLYASGAAPTARDEAILRKYDRLIAGKHCFAHCGACLESCPENVAIHDVLRYRMYFDDYGDQKQAMQLYAKLDRQADVCAGCAAPCTGACPWGVPIQDRTLGAHELLTLS
jgi:aryl-alcohol dehydrogenase-like predicted oxidoreductase